MRTHDALSSARGYLTILIGSLLGSMAVVWMGKQMPARVESSGRMTLGQDFPSLPAPRELTFDEAIWTQMAWQYYVNNIQPNSLTNAHDDEPWLSLWSADGYLFAVVTTEQLHTVATAEGNEHIAAALFALGQLPLDVQGLPAAQYHVGTLQILGNPDSSTTGMGHLLTALQTLLWHYPQHATAVRDLFNQWRVGALINSNPVSQAAASLHHWALAADEPRDSFGYRLYANHTLRLIDNAAGLVVTSPPQGQQMIDIGDVMVPDEELRTPWGRQPSLINLPYLLTGLELGFDTQSAGIAWRIIQTQRRRHSLRVSKPPISTDYTELTPDYASALVDRQPQGAFAPRSTTPEQTAITSTRTAFAQYALFRSSWSEALRQQVQTLQVLGRGWQRGLNLNRSVNDVVDGDTNAIMLESLTYISRGQMLCLACLSPAPLPSSSAGATP